MFKKIALGFCVINFMAYAAEEPATSTSAAAISAVPVPDISPKAFGVSGGEPYLKALHDFAQVLLMQHRCFTILLNSTDNFEKSLKWAQDKEINLLKRIAWLGQTPDHCAISNADPEFFERLQEIRQALIDRKEHELIYKTRGRFPIFAASSKGIELLLKHRSLFLQDTLDVKKSPLIDKIYQEAMQQANEEVRLLATVLKLNLEQSILELENREQMEQGRTCLQNLIHFPDRCKLSAELSNCLKVTRDLIVEFSQAYSTLQIPGTPTRLKLEALAKYNQVQPQLYAAVRKELARLTLCKMKTDRRFFEYSKTAQGEMLPHQLDPIVDNNAQKGNKDAGPMLQLEQPHKKSPKQKTEKKHQKKNKKTEKKVKKHKQSTYGAVLHDGPEEIAEQPDLSLSSNASVLPVHVPDVQEERSEVEPSASFNAPQELAPIAGTIESPAVEAPAIPAEIPSTLVQQKQKIVETDVAPACVVQRAVPLLIAIPDYSDGRVLSAKDGDTVLIDDPCNGMQLSLIPTEESPRFVGKMHYQENVLLWFKSVQKALYEQGYLNPASEKYVHAESELYETVRTHRFSRLVDNFIPTMGVKGSMPSRKSGHADEIAVAIPGFVEIAGRQKPCLFAYLVNSSTYKCFHRNIEYRIGQKMVADFYRKGYFEVEFPTLDWKSH